MGQAKLAHLKINFGPNSHDPNMPGKLYAHFVLVATLYRDWKEDMGMFVLTMQWVGSGHWVGHNY
jgi:hypothetical protein